MRDSKGRFIKGYKRVVSEETRRKISESCKKRGVGKWMNGKKASEETKTKMSKNNSRYWKGKQKPHTVESKKKISEALKGHKTSNKVSERAKILNRNKFGKEHPCWKEDKKTPLYKSIRNSHQYKKWRNAIFLRDNFTCVFCQKNKCYVEADHYPMQFIEIIRSENINTLEKSFNSKKLWDTDNGRTLCRNCHIERHKV